MMRSGNYEERKNRDWKRMYADNNLQSLIIYNHLWEVTGIRKKTEVKPENLLGYQVQINFLQE